MFVEIICSRALQHKLVSDIGLQLLGDDLSPLLCAGTTWAVSSQRVTCTL